MVIICLHVYEFKYSYQIQIVYIQLYGFMYSEKSYGLI